MTMPAGRLDLLVPAVPESVSEVRHVIETLGLSPTLLEAARLLVSELVTNSVRHSGLGPDEQVRVTVRDRPTPASSPVAGTIRPAPGAESGWGLYLVDQLASRWGTASGEEGGYWFELETRAA